MAFQPIAANETDSNSPLNQTVMDKLRLNGAGFNNGTAIGTNAITKDHIGTDQVEQAEIAALAVGTAQIKDNVLGTPLEAAVNSGAGTNAIVVDISTGINYSFYPALLATILTGSPAIGGNTFCQIYNHNYTGGGTSFLVLDDAGGFAQKIAIQAHNSAGGGHSFELRARIDYILV